MGIPTFCYYFYPPPTIIVHFFIHFCPKYTPLLTTLRPSKGGLKRQSLLQTWCGPAPRRGPSANGYDAWRFGSCGPGRKILAAAGADLVWVCAPRGPSANNYDAWRFGSCGPGRKILAAAAADLVWVCAPPRTIRKWLRRLAFWILRTRAQDSCSCCLIFRTRVDEKVDNSGCLCVCFLPIHSGHQWTYQPGSHRRKVTQDF